jgi:predicted nucleotidyltransferase
VLAEICRRDGIATLAVFGSVARDEESADSDVDLLHDLPGRDSAGRSRTWPTS